jgi:hypothetical protein
VKAYAFLSRRGYPSGVVRTVLEDLRRDAPPEDLEVED